MLIQELGCQHQSQQAEDRHHAKQLITESRALRSTAQQLNTLIALQTVDIEPLQDAMECTLSALQCSNGPLAHGLFLTQAAQLYRDSKQQLGRRATQGASL